MSSSSPPPPPARRGLFWGRGAAANAAAAASAAAAAAVSSSSPAASPRASASPEKAPPPSPGEQAGGGSGENEKPSQQPREPAPTWIDDVFRGTLVSETRCLSCEASTQRSEPFYDLSLEVAPDSSLTGCLRTFSKIETMGGEDKLRCENCGRLQEAQKRLRVAALPRVLCLHLKRFKYFSGGGDGGGNDGGLYGAPRMRKLGHRVAFPRELKLGPVVASAGSPDAADATLHLVSVVVHVGAGASHGHYVAFVRVRKGKGKKGKKGEGGEREEGKGAAAAKKKEKEAANASPPPRPLDEESSSSEDESEDKMDEDGSTGSSERGGESDTESGSDSDDDSEDSEDSDSDDSDSPWLLLDDDVVERAAPGALAATFGATRGGSFGGVDHGYILIYERCD